MREGTKQQITSYFQFLGFRKGDFRVLADKPGRKVTVKGRRSLGDGKFMHLERVFAVPKDTQIDEITGKLDGGCLSLFMPKEVHPIQVELIHKKQPTTIEVSVDRFEKHKKKGLARKETIVADVKWRLHDGTIDGLLETISTNKKVIAVAVAAFSAGLFVSQKLR